MSLGHAITLRNCAAPGPCVPRGFAAAVATAPRPLGAKRSPGHVARPRSGARRRDCDPLWCRYGHGSGRQARSLAAGAKKTRRTSYAGGRDGVAPAAHDVHHHHHHHHHPQQPSRMHTRSRTYITGCLKIAPALATAARAPGFRAQEPLSCQCRGLPRLPYTLCKARCLWGPFRCVLWRVFFVFLPAWVPFLTALARFLGAFFRRSSPPHASPSAPACHSPEPQPGKGCSPQELD